MKPDNGDNGNKSLENLDYYNEDMSRKAVGKLFGAGHGLDDDTMGKVAGGYVSSGDIIKKPLRERERDMERIPPSKKFISLDLDIEKPKKQLASAYYEEDDEQYDDYVDEQEAAESERQLMDDLDHDMSIYSRQKPVNRERKAAPNPSAEFYAKRKPKPEIRAVEKPEKYEKHPKASEPRRQSEPKGAEPNLFLFKTAVSLAFVLILMVLAAVVFKVNSNLEFLQQFEKTAEEGGLSAETIKAMREESAQLRSTVEGLTLQLEEIQQKLGSGQTNYVEDSTEAPPSNPSEAGDQNEGGETTYTVKSGDSLSRISSKFYGTTNGYQKIKDANNLKSDNLTAGQVLVIPK